MPLHSWEQRERGETLRKFNSRIQPKIWERPMIERKEVKITVSKRRRIFKKMMKIRYQVLTARCSQALQVEFVFRLIPLHCEDSLANARKHMHAHWESENYAVLCARSKRPYEPTFLVSFQVVQFFRFYFYFCVFETFFDKNKNNK